MNKPVPLIRRFMSVPDHYQHHDATLEKVLPFLGGGGARSDWSELRDLYRVVILADAGAGKTFELKAEAERMVKKERPAFFIRIEDIDEAFGSAFEVGSADVFEKWLAGTGEAWFFLDSIDEVRLDSPRAFEAAIRAFADRIHDARQRAHVYISSRPYAWRTSLDRALVEGLLPYASDQEEPRQEQTRGDWYEGGRGAISLYQLSPLDDDDIRIFAGHRDISDADAFLDAVARTNLHDRAQVPFDLEDLLAIWRETGYLDRRLEVLELGLKRRLSPKSRGELSLNQAMSGARRLALASTLTGQMNIRMPGAQGEGLEAADVLLDWDASDIRQLLGRGVFSDAIYSFTRFRHRENRELLAAQQLGLLLQQPDDRALVADLLFKTVYGETVIAPRTRPLLPWLILFDETVLRQALSIDPELATEGGDAARLPLDIRSDILRSMVEKIAAGKSSGGSNTEVARIAQGDLADETRKLLLKHTDNEQVVFFLGRMVWQGQMATVAPELRSIAVDPSRDLYSRIVAVRAIGASSGGDDIVDMWTSINATAKGLSRRLLAELVDIAPPSGASVDLLLQSLELAESHETYKTTGLSNALYEFADRLPMTNEAAAEKPLVRLIDGMAALLAREPHIERRDCRVSEPFTWLMGPALHTISRLIQSRSQACLGQSVLGVLGRVPALRQWGHGRDNDRKNDLKEAVPRWKELNDALFWHTVEDARLVAEADGKRVTDDWDIFWIGHFWKFEGASFHRTIEWVKSREHIDDRSVALSVAFRIYSQNGRLPRWRLSLWRAVKGNDELEGKLTALMRPAPSRERTRSRAIERGWERRRREEEAKDAAWTAEFAARMRANPAAVRAPSGLAPGQISQAQAYLLQKMDGDGMRMSRGVGSRWQALIPEFGQEVAEAFRDGARHFWRHYRPILRSEGADSGSIPYALIYAMAGLDIEAGEDHQGLSGLSAADARHALRYATWELNGFPDWFEPLYRRYPEIGFDLVWGEVEWQLANSVEPTSKHYILQDLVYHAPWLHSALATPILGWVNEHGVSSSDTMRYARTIILSGGLAPSEIALLAQRLCEAPSTPDDQKPAWFALWIDCDPDAALPVLRAMLASVTQPEDSRFAERFVVALVGGRGEGISGSGLFKTPARLGALYELMHRHIRVEEDLDRTGGGVYSPSIRDDAQEARSRLFSLLTDIPGEESYREMRRLADNHPVPAHRESMRLSAHQRAVIDSDHEWSLGDSLHFLRAVPTKPN